jgi:hypothetical protein
LRAVSAIWSSAQPFAPTCRYILSANFSILGYRY